MTLGKQRASCASLVTLSRHHTWVVNTALVLHDFGPRHACLNESGEVILGEQIAKLHWLYTWDTYLGMLQALRLAAEGFRVISFIATEGLEMF